MRLFIFGNGFDIDHGIESQYVHFKEFLEQNYVPSFNREYVTFPNVDIGKDGDVVVNSNDASQILYALLLDIPISSNWCDFEDCLGKLNYHEILNLVDKDEDNPFHYYYNLEDIIYDLNKSLLFSISGIFCEWVDEIDISQVKKKYSFNNNDLFLTFNYTEVLEYVYGINNKNICHIHGSRKENCCIVGHGDKDRLFDDYDDIISFKISEIHNQLMKKVEYLYREKQSFFDRIYNSDVTEIILFGLSDNDIDAFYLKQLFSNIDTSRTRLFLSEYDDKNNKEKKLSWLNGLGYRGKYVGPFKPL